MADSAKGSMENPYSMSEYEQMLDNGTWKGGFVKDDAGDVTYAMGEATCNGYSGCGSGSDEGSDDEEGCGSDDEEGCGSDNEDNPDSDGKGGTGNEGNETPGGNPGGNPGGSPGGTPGGYSSNSQPNAGEGKENDVHYYTYAEIDEMMDNGTWHGGYVKGVGYVAPKELSEIRPLPVASSGEQIYQRALKYEGVPYRRGGVDMNGLDCSGLVSVVLGLKTRWTTGSGDIPGLTRIKFTSKANLRKGDILVWKYKDKIGHAAIFVNGDTIFHAHGKVGSPTNHSHNLGTYWLDKTNTYVDPIIYRKED